jgi:hypothetical protein
MATMGVKVGSWCALERAAAEAPDRPAVLQVCAETLLSFPRGKSAIVLYTATAADEPLVAFVAGRGAALLARAAVCGGRLVRSAEAAPCPRRNSNGSCGNSRNGSAPRYQATQRNDCP